MKLPSFLKALTGDKSAEPTNTEHQRSADLYWADGWMMAVPQSGASVAARPDSRDIIPPEASAETRIAAIKHALARSPDPRATARPAPIPSRIEIAAAFAARIGQDPAALAPTLAQISVNLHDHTLTITHRSKTEAQRDGAALGSTRAVAARWLDTPDLWPFVDDWIRPERATVWREQITAGPLADLRKTLLATPFAPAGSDWIARILDAVESPLFLGFPGIRALPAGTVPVSSLSRTVELLVSDDGLERAEFTYFPGVLPEIHQALFYTLDPDTQTDLIARQTKIQDALSAGLFARITPRVDALGPRLIPDVTPCGPATGILSNEVQAMVLNLLSLALITPLSKIPVARAMLEILEIGAIPCGYLGIDTPYDTVDGRLCAWLGPIDERPAQSAPQIELDAYLGQSIQDIAPQLHRDVPDLVVETVAQTAFLSSKSGGFFLVTGPSGDRIEAYKVFLRATDDYAAARHPIATRIADLKTLADCTARFGAPDRDIPSLRLPGRPPTRGGQLYRQDDVQISALSENGHDLDEIAVRLMLDAAN